MLDEIDWRHVHTLHELIRPQACAISRAHADENQWGRQGSYAQSDSAVPGLAGGKLLSTLSATNYFNSKHTKSFVYYEIKFDLRVTIALPNRSK